MIPVKLIRLLLVLAAIMLASYVLFAWGEPEGEYQSPTVTMTP